MADVALPLVHDEIASWDLLKPDLVQRMLLAGVAVDSPGDAAALHPDMFSGANQAKMAFRAAGFGCRFPISSSYRDLTLKSATYRRTGRGRSQAHAWWPADRDAGEVRQQIVAACGPLADWTPCTSL